MGGCAERLMPVLLVALASCVVSSSRQLMRPLPAAETGRCMNTKQGQWRITDDTGKVCSLEQVDWSSGCCAGGDLHSCMTCSEEDRCCASYEHCVSCCLAPENDPHRRRMSSSRAPGHPSSGVWETDFEFCRGRCRTTHNSTNHENAFINDRRHCYSDTGRPLLPGTHREQLPAGVVAVPSNKEQSCKSACSSRGMKCTSESMLAVNDCNRLLENFPCEAGCEVGSESDLPGYTLGSAPKSSKPTVCLITHPSAQSVPCDGGLSLGQRMCGCSK